MDSNLVNLKISWFLISLIFYFFIFHILHDMVLLFYYLCYYCLNICFLFVLLSFPRVHVVPFIPGPQVMHLNFMMQLWLGWNKMMKSSNWIKVQTELRQILLTLWLEAGKSKVMPITYLLRHSIGFSITSNIFTSLNLVSIKISYSTHHEYHTFLFITLNFPSFTMKEKEFTTFEGKLRSCLPILAQDNYLVLCDWPAALHACAFTQGQFICSHTHRGGSRSSTIPKLVFPTVRWRSAWSPPLQEVSGELVSTIVESWADVPAISPRSCVSLVTASSGRLSNARKLPDIT